MYIGLVRPGPEYIKTYEKMWQLFVHESDPQEKERLLIGLADVREPAIIMRQEKNQSIPVVIKNFRFLFLIRYLERVADENLVRRHNFFEALGKIASSSVGLDIVWNFLR